MFARLDLGADQLVPIPFCNAERKRLENNRFPPGGNSEENLQDLIQHTRMHSIPSRAPSFFNLLERWPTPTAQ